MAKEGNITDRTTSLAEFAINNPSHLTPERRTVAYEIIERAGQLWREGVTLDAGERKKFAAAMKREGQPLTLSPEQINLALWRPEGGNSGAVPSI